MAATTTVTNGVRQLTVLTGKDATNVLRLAEDAYLPGHFDNIITQLELLIGKPLRWKPLGGEGRVAHSALGSAGEATHLLSEPVINFMDAALEMMWELAKKQGDFYEPQSMAEAAARWFGIPTGGLPAWDTRKGDAMKAFQALARLSQLLVRHGSSKDSPTIVFLDSWLGQHPVDHEDTFLSIHRGLKANIPFLAGQYGHGAGFTFAFTSGGQILVARRHPDLLESGYDDLVGLSLVRRLMPSETGNANPTYWYAVCPDTETPLAFHPSSLGDPRWHGLRRTAIDYEMRKSGERDIYFALDHYINNPALPYAFKDERTSEGPGRQFRFMQGTASRLQRLYEDRGAKPGKNEIRVPYRRTSVIDLDAFIGDGQQYGTMEVTTTFVKQEDTGKGNELYAPPKEAETWTLNGQRHHARSRLHFGQDPIRLEAIRDNLLVDVRLDKLSPDAKAMLLTTDRQGAAEREISLRVEEAIDEQMRGDDELQKLNEQALADALAKAAGSNFEDLDRELAQFQYFVRKTTKKVRVKKQTLTSLKRKRPVVPPLPPISPLHQHPTFLRFRKMVREVLHIAPGKTASVLLEADAVDGYFGANLQPLFGFNPPMGIALTVYSKEELQDGRMRVRIKAAPTAALGLTRLMASYLPPNATMPLTTVIDVEIAVPTPRQKGPGRPTPTTAWEWEDQQVDAPPKHSVIYESISPTWAETGMTHWTTDTIAEYKNGMVYVNGDYDPLQQLLTEVAVAQQTEYLKLYMAPVIMAAVSIAGQEAKPPKDENGISVPLDAAYRTAAFRSAGLSSIFMIRKMRKLGFGGAAQE